MKLANSLPAEEPLQPVLLSAPIIRKILGDSATPGPRTKNAWRSIRIPVLVHMAWSGDSARCGAQQARTCSARSEAFRPCAPLGGSGDYRGV